MRSRPELRLVVVAAVFAWSCGPVTPAEELCLTASSQAMSRVCQGASTVTGPDVSYYQGTVRWTQVKAAGNAFAITRVSDGLTHVDSQFAANWPGIRSAGLVRGVYQFFRPGLDPVAQADLLLAKVQAAGGFQPDDLPPVLDMEATDGVATATIRLRMQAWLDRIEHVTHKKPIIYTAAFMNSVVGTGFSRYPLWVANYGVTCPMVPDSWSSWRFWQATSTQAVPGITGNSDYNRWNGTLATLQAFARDTVAAADAGTRPDAGASVDAGRTDAGTASSGAMDGGAAEVLLADDAGTGLGPEGGSMGDGKLLFVRQCASVTGT